MYLININHNRYIFNHASDLLEYLQDELNKTEFNSAKKFLTGSKAVGIQLKDGTIIRKVNNSEELYNNYQLLWLIKHNKSISDIIKAVFDYKTSHNITDPNVAFCEWTINENLNGNIWLPYKTWQHKELFELFNM